MKRRLLALLTILALMTGCIPVNAAQNNNDALNPALLDWSRPAYSYTTKGSKKAEKGYSLKPEMVGQVLKVKTTNGGWTKLEYAEEGDYSFTVDTDQMKTDSFNLLVWRYRDEEGNQDLKQTDTLHYESENGIVTQVIHDVYADETLFWYANDDNYRGGYLASTLVMSVSPGDCTQEKQEVTWELVENAWRPVAEEDSLTGQPILKQIPEAGDTFVMGRYEQDNITDNGRERIEWTVLEVNEQKDQVLVISTMALDCILYHPSRSVVSWGNCSIRNWLNFDFKQYSLSAAEQACIIPQKVSGVMDEVTMLDAKQIQKYKQDKSGCLVTEYAANKDKPVNVAENGRGCWWVREDKTRSGGWISFVGRHGKVYKKNYTTTADNGVRPVMMLSLSALMSTPLGPDFTVLTGEVADASNPTVKLEGATVVIAGQTVTTDAHGRFALEAEAGDYPYHAECGGYISADGTFTVRAGSQTVYTIPMCRKMAENEYRVVLTWGLNPADLDSHLNGKTENGSAYHVFYHNLKEDGGKALLEWDDTDSYGPETTHFFAYPGREYVFSIHDYTNRANRNCDKMAQSGAKVTVYREDAEIASFSVPDADGTVWTVFSVRDEVLTPINQTGYCEDPRQVR